MVGIGEPGEQSVHDLGCEVCCRKRSAAPTLSRRPRCESATRRTPWRQTRSHPLNPLGESPSRHRTWNRPPTRARTRVQPWCRATPRLRRRTRRGARQAPSPRAGGEVDGVPQTSFGGMRNHSGDRHLEIWHGHVPVRIDQQAKKSNALVSCAAYVLRSDHRRTSRTSRRCRGVRFLHVRARPVCTVSADRTSRRFGDAPVGTSAYPNPHATCRFRYANAAAVPLIRETPSLRRRRPMQALFPTRVPQSCTCRSRARRSDTT